MKRPGAILAAIGALTIALAGCGSGADASSGSDAAFNQADADFIPAMNQVISQSTTLAETAEQQAADPAVRRFATSMKDAQYVQLDALVRLYEEAAKQPGLYFAHDHGESSSSIPGLLRREDVDRMTATRGRRFDRMFLTLAVRQQEGALALARTERAEGRSTATKELAAQVETMLSDQTAQLEQLLRS